MGFGWAAREYVLSLFLCGLYCSTTGGANNHMSVDNFGVLFGCLGGRGRRLFSLYSYFLTGTLCHGVVLSPYISSYETVCVVVIVHLGGVLGSLGEQAGGERGGVVLFPVCRGSPGLNLHDGSSVVGLGARLH